MDYYLYYISHFNSNIELDPSNYLECEDEDDVRGWIWDDVLESADIPGELEYSDWKIPESFWEEWRKLKGNE